MKLNRTKHLNRLFKGIIVCALTSVFFSCQETVPTPYSPEQAAPNAKAPVMNGLVNGNLSTTAFIPTVTNSGGYITFKGTSQFYTITITFPATTGVGDYGFDFADPGFSATIYDGLNTYTANATYGSGDFRINSIIGGRYSGTFSIIGQDAAYNDETVNGGVFSNL